MEDNLFSSLRGVLPALVTPLRDDGELDRDGVAQLVEYTLAGGVHGLMPLGSTGESTWLSSAARRAMLAAVIEAADGRVPVIAGIALPELAATIAEAEQAAEMGARAILVAPPYYYPIDQATVLHFFREVAKATPLPVLAYNIPQLTKVVVEPATLRALAEERLLAGVKDSSRDFEYFSRVCLELRGTPEFRIFTGADTMLHAALGVGASGTICGSANVAPRWVVDVFDAYERGDHSAARDYQDRLLAMSLSLRPGIMAVRAKQALEELGVCSGAPARPVKRLSSAERASLAATVAAWSLRDAPARA